jgi:hypothetical protein
MTASTEISWPTPQDVARRLLILKYVVIHGLATPPREMLAEWMSQWSAEDHKKFTEQAEDERERLWQSVNAVELERFLTPSERELLSYSSANMPSQWHANSIWRSESVAVLMWALGMINQLAHYDTQPDTELLNQIPYQGIPDFIEHAKLRPSTDISKMRDVAELWHWRSRTRQLVELGHEFKADPDSIAAGIRSFDDIVRRSAEWAARDGVIPPPINGDFPVKGKAYRDLTDEEWSEVRSITMERHFALNWLCGYAPGNRWDETPTDT